MNNITSHLAKVNQFDIQRELWLISSIIIFLTIIIIAIMLWAYDKNTTAIAIWITGAIISGIWWIWTMYIIKTLISHRRMEFYILQDIIIDLQETKKLTKELFDHSAEL